jgi:hypothetical protein
VQINQAGKILVGWAVPPPTPIPTRPLACFDPRAASLNPDRWTRRELALVFLADLEEVNGDGSISLQAVTVPMARQYGPGDVWFNAADPTLVIDRIVASGRPELGYLKLGTAARPDLQIKFSDGAPGFETLHRLNDLPRIPAFHGAWGSSKGLGEQPFRAWVTTHSRPLPVDYLDDAAEAFAPDSPLPGRAPVRKLPLADAIRAWYSAQGPVRAAHRETVFTLLKSWANGMTPQPATAYGGETKSALLAALCLHTITLLNAEGAAVTRNYRDWITAAYAEELDAWVRQKSPPGHPFVPAIAELGISQGDFLYTFTFSTGSALPVPKVIADKVPEPGKYLRLGGVGVAVGFNPFYVNVKKEKVTVKTDGAGLPVVDRDGKLVCTDAKLVFDTAQDALSGLIGSYLDIGFGFPRAGVDLKSVQILSANGALTKDDFGGASFELGQFKGPSVSNSVGRIQTSQSVMFAVSKHTPDVNYDLMTVVDTRTGVVPMSVNSPWDFFKPLLNPAKVLKPDWNAVKAGFAKGMFVSGGQQPRTHQLPATPQRPAPGAEVALTPEVDTFFEQDDNRISPRRIPILSLSARGLLEAALAQERAILINPRAERDVTGWASPEGPTPRNLDLSLARARALAQAYLDAFPTGTVVAVPPDRIVGLGEAPSLEPPAFSNESRLTDPETALGMTSADPGWRAAYERWLRDHRLDVALWPQWRKAQLRVSGQTIISVSGRQTP